MSFLNPGILWLLLLLVPLWALSFLDRRLSRKSLRLFWDDNLSRLEESWNRKKAIWLGKSLALSLFLIFSLIASARPVGDPEWTSLEQKGRDVFLLVDVSRSMDARDLYPSRLERVVWEIQETLPQMSGDRVGLILFSGSTLMTCPLTSDHAFLSMALESVSSSSVARGGTLLGDALRDTARILESDGSSLDRDILLITDGGDQESFPVDAAEQLGEKGIRLLILGLGSEDGAPVPDGEGGFLQYQGEQVITRIDHSLLREMAATTPGGKYLPVGSSSFQLRSIYRDLISSAGSHQTHQEEFLQYREFFGYFALPALIALLFLLFLQLYERRYR